MSIEHDRRHRRRTQRETATATNKLEGLTETTNIAADLIGDGSTRYEVNSLVVGIIARTAHKLHNEVWDCAFKDGNLDNVQVKLSRGVAREITDFVLEKLIKPGGSIIFVPDEKLNPGYQSQAFQESNIPGLYVEIIIPKKEGKSRRIPPFFNVVGKNHLAL